MNDGSRFPKRQRRQATFTNMSTGDEIDEHFEQQHDDDEDEEEADDDDDDDDDEAKAKLIHDESSHSGKAKKNTRGVSSSSSVHNLSVITQRNKDESCSSENSTPTAYGAAAMRVHQEGHLSHGNELYCICRREYDPRMFMIGCDRCDGWFHAACVNISINEAKRMESYTCPNCQKPSTSSVTSSTNSSGVLPPKKKRRKQTSIDKPVERVQPDITQPISSTSSSSDITRSIRVDINEHEKLQNDEADYDCFMTSEDNEDISLPHVSLYMDIDKDTSISKRDFNCDESLDQWTMKTPDERDDAMVAHLSRIIVDCETSLNYIEVQQRHASAGMAFARRISLQSRYDALSRLHGIIDIVTRSDRCLEPAIHPAIASTLCLRCKGDIPTHEFVLHLHNCLCIDVVPSRNLMASVIPSSLSQHITEDMNVDEDDWNGNCRLLICGYPLAYCRANLRDDTQWNINVLPLHSEYCDLKRQDCITHAGWYDVMIAELAQHSSLQKRRFKRLELEIDMVNSRIAERQESIKRAESILLNTNLSNNMSTEDTVSLPCVSLDSTSSTQADTQSTPTIIAERHSTITTASHQHD